MVFELENRFELDPFKNILPLSYVMKHNKIIKICQLQSSLFPS